MKSKRAEEAIERYRKKFTAGFVTKNEVETVKEYCRLFTEVVELAEQDAEEQYQDDLHHYQLMMNDTCSEMIDERDEEITSYRKELEESKRREELARKVIDDQRKKIEEVKARAVESFRESCPIKHPVLNDKGALCDKINIIGFGCNCPVSDCKFLLNFFQILNER
jgi:hypothetical protein